MIIHPANIIYENKTYTYKYISIEMTVGGFLQLTTYQQDGVDFTMQNPNITFFKSVFKKSTNFAQENIRVNFKHTSPTDFFKPMIFSVEMDNIGHILNDIHLMIDVPMFYQNMELKPQWIEDIGIHMIDEVRLTIGGDIIQRFSGDWLSIYYRRKMKWEKYNLIKPNINIPLSISPNIYLNPSTTLTVPIPFWFTKDTGQGFPLMCLEYGKMLIEITLKPISQWMTIIEPNQLSPYYGKRVAPYYGKRTAAERPDIIDKIIGLQYPTEHFHFYINTNVSFLDKDELDKIVANTHDYLIEQIDEVVLNDIVSDTATITLNKRQGLKEIWLFGRRNDSYSRNDYANYTTETTVNELQVPYAYLGACYTPTSFLQQYWRYYYMDMKQIPVSHIIESFRIMIDDKERTTDLTHEYASTVQPYQSVLNNYLSIPGLLYYSFSLNPDEFQPSGFYNFARVVNAQIQLKLTQRPPPRPTVSTLNPAIIQHLSKNTGEFKPYVSTSTTANFAWMYQIRAELVFYNILRITSGICEVLLRR